MNITRTKLLLALSIFTTGMNAKAVSDVCVAQRFSDFGKDYGSSMYYHVSCKSENFDTPKYFTSFIIPLPYAWNKVAKNNLLNIMQKKGYYPMVKVEEVKTAEHFTYGFNQKGVRMVSVAFGNPVYIFNKSYLNANYCAVLRSNKQMIGMNNNQTVYDYVVSCDYNKIHETHEAVNNEEWAQYIQNLGLKLVLSTPYLESNGNATLQIYQKY